MNGLGNHLLGRWCLANRLSIVKNVGRFLKSKCLIYCLSCQAALENVNIQLYLASHRIVLCFDRGTTNNSCVCCIQYILYFRNLKRRSMNKAQNSRFLGMTKHAEWYEKLRWNRLIMPSLLYSAAIPERWLFYLLCNERPWLIKYDPY
jgi:hypothetical protein